jgi:hypothetical protein
MTDEETISFKVTEGKTVHPLILPASTTITHLKEQIQSLSGIEPSLQKYSLFDLTTD